MRARFDDLPERLASAFVLAAIALACLWVGGVSWAVLVALTGAGVATEWVRIANFRPAGLPRIVLPALVAAVSLATAAGLALPLLALLAVAAAGLATASRSDVSGRIWLAGGMIYVGLAGTAAIWLRLETEAGRGNLLFVLAIVWASDTGAYLVGRFVGGPKLVPRISPSKTWAGMVGGVALAIAAGLAVARVFASGATLGGIAVSIVLALAAQGGDLLESVFKRRFGVKDSSKLIPGHGGLLDRVDGVLATIPIAALLVLALGPGAELWR